MPDWSTHASTLTSINTVGDGKVRFMSGMTLQPARLSHELRDARGVHRESAARLKSGHRTGGGVAAMPEVAYQLTEASRRSLITYRDSEQASRARDW